MADPAQSIVNRRAISFQPAETTFPRPERISGGDGGGDFYLRIKGPRGEVTVNGFIVVESYLGSPFW